MLSPSLLLTSIDLYTKNDVDVDDIDGYCRRIIFSKCGTNINLMKLNVNIV